MQKFNHLARYSLYGVATEERKMDRFLGGLNPQLCCALSVFDFPYVQTLVNKAFIAEREHKLVSDNKSAHNDHKRKFERKKEMQPVQKVHTWQPTHVAYQPNWKQNVNMATTQVKNDVLNPVLENHPITVVDKPDIMPNSVLRKNGPMLRSSHKSIIWR